MIELYQSTATINMFPMFSPVLAPTQAAPGHDGSLSVLCSGGWDNEGKLSMSPAFGEKRRATRWCPIVS